MNNGIPPTLIIFLFLSIIKKKKKYLYTIKFISNLKSNLISKLYQINIKLPNQYNTCFYNTSIYVCMYVFFFFFNIIK